MMRYNLVLLSAILTLTVAGPAFAQRVLTLEEARTGALRSSKTLQSAMISVESAALDRKLRSYDLLPSLSATAKLGLAYSEGDVGDVSGALGLSVSQTVYDGGKTFLLMGIDSIAEEIAATDARAEYLDVINNVDSAFYAALQAKASLESAQMDLDAYREHLRLAEAKLETGVIAKYDYMETEAETASKEAALVQAQGAFLAAKSKLASLAGLSGPFDPESIDITRYEDWMKKVSGCSGDSMNAFIEAVFTRAQAENPDLKGASLSCDQADQHVLLARADYLPSVSASASHSFNLESGRGLDVGDGSVSLSASIPLDIWVTNVNVKSKRLSAKTEQLNREETWRSLQVDIQSAAYECVSSARSVLSSRKALEYAEAYYASALEMFRLSAS